MLFSQAELAQWLSDNFECAWHSVRPVPQITVDFGNDTVLRRTLLGNIVTWYCRPDGTAFDALPGLVDAAEYRRRSQEALRRFADRGADGAFAWQRCRDSHKAAEIVAGLRVIAPTNTVGAVSKMRLEAPIHRALGTGKGQRTGKATKEPSVARGPRPADMVKSMGERPLHRALRTGLGHGGAPGRGTTAAASSLATLTLDTNYNRSLRYPQIHALFAALPTAQPPAELRTRVFEDILHVPIHDPFLGLAPAVLGGEGGRTIGGHDVRATAR